MRKCKPLATDKNTSVVLNENMIFVYYPKDSERSMKTVLYKSTETALQEFNRLTQSYRGCGKRADIHKTPQATVFYNQLIIQC